MPDSLSNDLIGRNARSNLRALALEWLNSGQKDACRTGMISRPVPVGPAFIVRQTTEHEQIVFQ